MASAKPISRGADPKVVPAAPVVHLDLSTEAPRATDIRAHIDAYDAAHEAYERALRRADSVEIGREPTEAEIMATKDAEALFLEAEIVFCEYVPKSLEESRVKADFIVDRKRRGHFEGRDAFAALLRSMTSMASPQREQGRSEIVVREETRAATRG